MSAGARLAAFAALLVAVLGAAVGVGRAVGPVDAEPTQAAHGTEHGNEHTEHTEHTEEGDAAALPGGVTSTLDGYSLELFTPTAEPGRTALTLTLTQPDGGVLTTYEREHEKLLHLILVRRDLTGFQHVHPRRIASNGSWTAPVDLTPGSWRVYADFTPAGHDNLVLGADLAVPGTTEAPVRVPESRHDAVDGFDVHVDGDLVAGEHSMVRLTIERDGAPVTDLEPYLGAYGHLVALRESDLAYLHVHPEDGPPGPTIEFGVEVPSPGRYHLFLDFQHDGVVRTVHVVVSAQASPDGEEESDDHDH